MPLQLPNLDDRTYDDLVEEARSLIPTYAPEWTNHNPSDPGITLIELFAYLTELLIYRLNRVTDANIVSFLKLLNGPGWQPSDDLAKDTQQTIQQLRQKERAVTCADFEELAVQADDRVARAHCLPRRNLLMQDFESDRSGYIGVLIVPKTASASQLADIIAKVKAYLEPRRLLTTHLHVTEAQYLKLKKLEITIIRSADAKQEDVEKSAQQALKQFLEPLTTEDKPNWAFGRNVFVSELYQLLDQLPGVDYITQVEVETDAPNRRIVTSNGAFVGIEIKPYELVDADFDMTLNISRNAN